MNTDYLKELQFDKLAFGSLDEDLNLISDLYGLNYNQIESNNSSAIIDWNLFEI